ncbi:MAG: phytoene/squalene synthase family protein [Pseudomonadota bacterium]
MTTSISSNANLLNALREIDPLRYAAILYMPQDKRVAVASIWLFQSEIERIRDLISEPLPGEIRLQWWHDVFLGMRDGEAKQNPLAVDLLATIDANGLSRDMFVAFLEAMTFDLYDDPMQETAQFEGHMGEAHSVFFQMVCQILAGDRLTNGDGAGHAGVAFGVARCLQDMAKHRARGQIYVPSEMLAAQGVSTDQWRAVSETAEKLTVVKSFAAYGLEHLEKAKRAIKDAPKECYPAFLLLAPCAIVFDQARHHPSKAFAGTITPGPLRTQWLLLKAALRGL